MGLGMGCLELNHAVLALGMCSLRHSGTERGCLLFTVFSDPEDTAAQDTLTLTRLRSPCGRGLR